MEFIKTKTLNTQQKKHILKLWNQEYPKKLSLSNLFAFEEYLQDLENKHHLLLCDEQETIKGWGSKLINEAKRYNSELNGWVIDPNNELRMNGNKYLSPLGFYKMHGFLVFLNKPTTKEGITGIKVTWEKS